MHSIILALDSEGLPRIRVGIGRPQAGLQSAGNDRIIDHVLGGFSPAEEEVIKSALVQVSEAIGCFLCEGIEAAMRKFN
jgi:peptidyl-tRNA hydrolase, PTH1 family